MTVLNIDNLPDLTFVETEFTDILERNVVAYESVSGTTLPQDSVARIIVTASALLEQLQRVDINETGKQVMLQFSSGDNLDNLVSLLGLTRLTSTYATCTIQFVFPTAMVSDYSIPAGRQIQDAAGAFTFATDEILVIEEGDTTGTVTATCTVAGITPNDIAIGVISELQDTLAVEPTTVANTDITTGGGNVETDTQLRDRFSLASSIASTAGSEDSYGYYARTASTTIADVSVSVLNPGQVQICSLLVNGGIPGAPLLADILAACNPEDVRPLTDTPTSVAATAVPFDIDVTFDYLENASDLVSDIQDTFETNLENWANIKKEQLGADLVPDEIIKIGMNIEGVYRVHVTTPSYQVISAVEFPDIGTITVTIGTAYHG